MSKRGSIARTRTGEGCPQQRLGRARAVSCVCDPPLAAVGPGCLPASQVEAAQSDVSRVIRLSPEFRRTVYDIQVEAAEEEERASQPKPKVRVAAATAAATAAASAAATAVAAAGAAVAENTSSGARPRSPDGPPPEVAIKPPGKRPGTLRGGWPGHRSRGGRRQSAPTLPPSAKAFP